MQQRLGGDAADVEAGAAVGGALLHHGHLQPKLRGADGAHVAAGAGADDDQVVGHGKGSVLLSLSPIPKIAVAGTLHDGL